MSLVLTSLSDLDLRKAMYEKIKKQLEEIRLGKLKAKRLVLVVPAQRTLMTENEGFEALGGDGFFDFLVMSGAKLRENIQSECGYPQKTPINTIGRNMLLRKVVKNNSEILNLYGNVAESDGFLDMAGDFIVQLKQNDFNICELDRILEGLPANSILSQKLDDLKIICSEYDIAMSGKFTDSEDLLAFTTDQIPYSEYIRESVIWYYGFYSFTKREYAFLEMLKKHAADFNAAVLSGEDRYFAGTKTVSKLQSLGLKCENVRETPRKNKLSIFECSSIYRQSISIACDILRRVRDEGVHYGEIAVLTQDMDVSGESIKHVFQSLDIPYFMDEKQSMQYSLAARIICCCLNIVTSGFNRQDVIGLLKTGIFDLEDYRIEEFENYVVQYKVFDNAFLKPFKYGQNIISEETFESLESIRQKIASLFSDFLKSFLSSENVRSKTEVLYSFLSDTLCLPAFLEKSELFYTNEGFLDAAGEFSQSWDFVVGLFDQMVELIGDEQISCEEYADLLSSSFADAKIGILPQGNERVRIGSITRTALSSVKILYIAGFNDGIIPSDVSSNTILTETELDFLSSAGLELAKNSKTLADEELYQIEKILDTPCDELVVSYYNSDSHGDVILPSCLLDEIKISHPDYIQKNDIGDDDYIQNRQSVRSMLPQSIKNYALGDSMPEIFKYSYNLCCRDDVITDSLFFEPAAMPLGDVMSSELFSKNGRAYFSPTELEKYAECPFKHFVDYGLNAKKMREFGVDSANFGTICHFVLEQISKRLAKECMQKGLSITDKESPWMTISMDEIELMVKHLIHDNTGSLLDGLLDFDDANEYRTGRIEQACCIFVKQMVLQVQKGKIDSMLFESYFGEHGNLPPVKIETPFGTAVIEGKIDRADLLPSSEGKYVKIIDYKSGSKEFSIDKINAGLDLQLMIYFESILKSDDDYKPGGVFYYKIKDIESSLEYIDLISENMADDFVLQNAKNFALDGIVIKDKNILSAMDTNIIDEDKVQTDVFAAKNARIISADNMNALRMEFKDNLAGLCGSLKAGNVEINPTVFKHSKVGCLYCDYSSVCLVSLK